MADDLAAALRGAVAQGRPFDLGDIDAATAPAELWVGRSVDAKLVAQVIGEASAAGARFELHGARIIHGTLILRHSLADVPVRLTSCLIEEGIDCDFGAMADLNLKGSKIGPSRQGWGLTGRFVAVSGDLDLSHVLVEGGCRLTGAGIKGSLVGPGVRVGAHRRPTASDDATWAIDLTNATVAGDIDLSDADLDGGLCLAGTKVLGQVALMGAAVSAAPADGPPHGRRAERQISEYCALWGQGCQVAESFVACPSGAEGSGRPARFEGYVSLVSAKVPTSIDFSGAQFSGAPSAPAAGRRAPTRRGERRAARDSFGVDRQLVALDLFNASASSISLDQATCPPDLQVDLRNCAAGRFYPGYPGDKLWHKGQYGLRGLTYERVSCDPERASPAERAAGRFLRGWVKRAVDGDIPGPYLALADAARTAGEPANELKAKIMASAAAASWRTRALFGWVRYGYRPYLVGIPLALLGLATFAQVRNTSSQANGFVPAVVGTTSYSPGHCQEVAVRCLDPVAYALEAVIPVDQHQQSTWRPNRGSSRGDVLYWMLVVDHLFSWLLAGVFVASVGGMLKQT